MVELATIAAATKVVSTIIKAGLAGKALCSDGGWTEKHAVALRELFAAASELSAVPNCEGGLVDDRARYFLHVCETFGRSFREFWVGNSIVAGRRRPFFIGLQALCGDSEAQHSQEFDRRIGAAVQRWGESVSENGIALAKELTGSPIRSPAFRVLWEVFTEPRPVLDDSDCAALLSKTGDDTREFERQFLKFWWELLAAPAGQSLRTTLEASSETRRLLMRDLLLSDMASWGERHIFGNRRRERCDIQSELPFLSLDALYVEPNAALMSALRDRSAPRPIQQCLKDLLEDDDVRIILVSAHFGHGKSLSARRFARDLAVRYLGASAPGTERLPVFVRCQSDMVRDDTKVSEVVRRAWKRHAEANGIVDAALDDDVFSISGRGSSYLAESVVCLFDGLDEVSLNERELDILMGQLRSVTSSRFKVILFSRPEALPRKRTQWEFDGTRLLELEPFQRSHIEHWLNCWSSATGNTISAEKLEEKGLLGIAETPILLFMIGSTWGPLLGSQGQITKARLYEQFFRDTAGSKHPLDSDDHPVVVSTSRKLLDALRHLPGCSSESDALLWVMGRIAWEERCIEWKRQLPWSDKPTRSRQLRMADVEGVLQHELQIESSSSDLKDVLSGVVLALQADLQGSGGRILFGHQSFREFMVARYWADQLRQLVQADAARKNSAVLRIVRALGRARLLSIEDHSFDFLWEILFDEGGWPFGWSSEERKTLRGWAERFVECEELSVSNRQDAEEPLLREAALAIGSLIDTTGGPLATHDGSESRGGGITITPWALRSLVAWFWRADTGTALLFAPGLNCAKAKLSLAPLQCAYLAKAALGGADLRGASLGGGADLSGADLRGASLGGACLIDARLVEADLRGAHLDQASMICANLCGADLRGASLMGSDLRGATLKGAALDGANFRGADLSGASLGGTDLRGVNLELARLQDACYDDGTYLPQGLLPEHLGMKDYSVLEP